MPLILKGSAVDLDRECKLGRHPIDYVMLNLPYRCNYCCLKCCNQSRPIVAGARLTVAQISNALGQLKKLGARVLVIAGEGEPIIDPHFCEIVDIAVELGLLPYIFTNGSMIDENLAGWLALKKASLIINVDAFEEELYDELTGTKGAFAKAQQNLAAIREQYRDLLCELSDGTRVTSLAINMVLNQRNLGQAEKIREFCQDDIVFVINEPIGIGMAKTNWEMFRKAEGSTTVETGSPLGTLTGQSCSYLRHGVSIGADGSFLACAYALETAGEFGNILTDGIVEAHKKVLNLVQRFYATSDGLVCCYGSYAWPRCLLRHPKYDLFIEMINPRGAK